jgi:phosphoglycolate phosphatase-like HAD superfamily hydrolase
VTPSSPASLADAIPARHAAAAGIVFDIDGTLITKSGGNLHSMARAAREVLGSTLTLQMINEVPHLGDRPVPGWVDAQFLDALARSCGYPLADVRADLLPAYLAAYHADLDEGLSPGTVIPGIPALLERLTANGLPLALATGNAHLIAREKMTRLGLGDFFTYDPDHGFGDRLTSRTAIGAAALASLGNPAQTYLVGDTIADIESARANGARGVGVYSGAAPAAHLSAEGAWVVLPDATHLARLLFLPL